jgi:hypothetical protein
LLVSWCVGDKCDMVGSDDDIARSRRPDTEDRGWSSTGRVLSDRMIKRLSDAVFGLDHTQGDKEHELLDLASIPRLTISRFRSQN